MPSQGVLIESHEVFLLSTQGIVFFVAFFAGAFLAAAFFGAAAFLAGFLASAAAAAAATADLRVTAPLVALRTRAASLRRFSYCLRR